MNNLVSGSKHAQLHGGSILQIIIQPLIPLGLFKKGKSIYTNIIMLIQDKNNEAYLYIKLKGYYGWEEDLGIQQSYYSTPPDPRKLMNPESSDGKNALLLTLVPIAVVSL